MTSKKETEASLSFDLLEITKSPDPHLDVSLFDFGRFGFGHRLFVLLVIECTHDGDRGTFHKLFYQFLIESTYELLAVGPGGVLYLLTCAVGVIAVCSDREGDDGKAVFELDDVGIVTEFATDLYFFSLMLWFGMLPINLLPCKTT